MLIIASIIPPRTLTSVTFAQRASELNGVASSIPIFTISNFSYDYGQYSLKDWLGALQLNPNAKSYQDKPVKLSGFIFDPPNTGDHIQMVARFVVTCCAVDARPVGLYIDMTAYQGQFKADQWVEVSGKMSTLQIAEEYQLLIVPYNIKLISVPDEPYIY